MPSYPGPATVSTEPSQVVLMRICVRETHSEDVLDKFFNDLITTMVELKRERVKEGVIMDGPEQPQYAKPC